MAGDPEQPKGETPSPLPTESTNTLTRQGSLTPQWLQPKSTTGGGAVSGFQHPVRARLSDADRTPDPTRRVRSESLGGNEALMSKGRDAERPRAPKWVPDDRETWKPKERWANGPDSSKRWLDVQTAGRQKQGWGTGDVLSRSHVDRWNTEGGRWTEDRRHVDDKEYVPKNARWNDEERAERWRSGGGRGELATRGRGQPLRPQGVTRRTSSDVHVLDELNGLQADLAARRVDVRDGRHRYSKKQLFDVYDSLREKMGVVLTLPKGVDTSYPGLFRSDRKVVTEDEDVPKSPAPSPKNQPSVETGVAGIGHEELEADSWVYKDPVGQVQGPFSKQEVLAWWEEGYFSQDLPVQSQLSAQEKWVPLGKLLELWKVPIDKKNDAEDLMPAATYPARQLEACDSLATVGSHISSALLPDVNMEGSEEMHSSQAPAEAQSLLHSLPVQPQPQAQAQGAFQNPVSDIQQQMQNLLLQQRQKQAQQAANMGGLNFASASLGMSGMSGVRPAMAFQPTNPYMSAYGMQQQRPAVVQDNSLMTPGILEALQRLNAQQQTLNQQTMNRAQMQSSPYGYDLNAGLNQPLQGQLQGNANLAALLSQSQMAQRNVDQRTAMASDLQRLLQARSLQTQGSAYGGMNNPLSAGAYGGVRSLYTPQQPQQNLWGNQMPGGYNALNSLLQQQRPQQQAINQQLAQQMLLNKLQGMRFPNQQLGMNRPQLQTRENLLSLAAMQNQEAQSLDATSQYRQKNNMSPPNPVLQSGMGMDPHFALIGQTSTPSSVPLFNYPNQKQPPFPQHILQHMSPRPEMNASLASEASNPPVLGLDPVQDSVNFDEDPPRTSPVAEQPAKTNAWGVSPKTATTASLLEIQEQESKSAQQNITAKERQVQAPTSGPMTGPGWNVQPIKTTSLVDIMQEDAESKRQAQAAALAKQQSTQQPSTKQGTVWSKKAGGRPNSQTVPGGESGKANALTSKEHSAKEAKDGECGFWDLESSKKTGDSLDMDFSHDVVESEVHLFSGQLKISQQFREWCRSNMVEMGGSGDIALIEFLLSLKSRSEIAEYIQEYFKEAPADKLSVFISEFLKRKDADPAQIKKERGGQKKKKTTKTKDSTKISSDTVELEAVSSSGASESHGLEAGSGKAMRTREVKSKPKAKKQAKGQHVPADMLGFKSNVNFDSLYRGNSNG